MTNTKINDSDKVIKLQSLQFTPSTKLNALISDLKEIQKLDGVKMVVFSQWATMLDHVQSSLKNDNLEFVRLDGSMTQKRREEVLKTFKDVNGPRILIATLRSTGVGLNLTVASRVFLLDPWYAISKHRWNESVEQQAIDRVHRLGQTREVKVIRYIMKHSVEEKMLAIQLRKSKLVGAITGGEEKIGVNDLIALFD